MIDTSWARGSGERVGLPPKSDSHALRDEQRDPLRRPALRGARSFESRLERFSPPAAAVRFRPFRPGITLVVGAIVLHSAPRDGK
jgi:hypothetical protein